MYQSRIVSQENEVYLRSFKNIEISEHKFICSMPKQKVQWCTIGYFAGYALW